MLKSSSELKQIQYLLKEVSDISAIYIPYCIATDFYRILSKVIISVYIFQVTKTNQS